MNKVTFSNTKIAGALARDGKNWQAHINSAGSTTTADIAAEVAANLKDSAPYVEHILNQTGLKAAEHLAGGERVVLEGFGRIELVGEGSFDSEDATWDPSRNAIGLAFVPCAAIRDSIREIVPENTLKPVSIRLLGLQDAETFEQNVLVAGHTAMGQGKGLNVNAANPDEGVFLVPNEGAEIRCPVTDSTAGTFDATVPAETPEGKYALEFRGRAGQGTNRRLVTVRLSDVIVKAA